MKLNRFVCLGLLAAALATGAPAWAQIAAGHTSMDGNPNFLSADKSPEARFIQGSKFLQEKQFDLAAAAFLDVLQHDSRNANANYLMGAAQIGREDWTQARTYLIQAVKSNPKLADARGKLGWVNVKLGDLDGAKAQRAELEKLNKTCKNSCPDPIQVSNAIAMIDKALAKPG